MGVKLNPFTTPERVFGKGEDAGNLIAHTDLVYQKCLQRAMVGILKRQAKDAAKSNRDSLDGTCDPGQCLCLCFPAVLLVIL